MLAVDLAEEAAFADAEYLGWQAGTAINERMFAKYANPRQRWDWRQFAAMQLGDMRGKRMLDYGCGQGEESAYFLRLGATVTAVDISEVGLRLCRERAAANGLSERLTTITADALHLPLPDTSFDLVHGMGILHHVGIEAGLAEVRRVLRPSGKAVFLEPLGNVRVVERVKEWLTSRLGKRLHLRPVTSGEENLRLGDIQNAARGWSSLDIQRFHLIHRARKLFAPRFCWPWLLRLDMALLTIPGPHRTLAGAAVLTLVK